MPSAVELTGRNSGETLRMRNAPARRDIKIARAAHLMHLEENRYALYRDTETFPKARDTVPPLLED